MYWVNSGASIHPTREVLAATGKSLILDACCGVRPPMDRLFAFKVWAESVV